MIDLDDFFKQYDMKNVNSEEFIRLSNIMISCKFSEHLRYLNPHSKEYQENVLELYNYIRGSVGEKYDPIKDEISNFVINEHIFSDVSPWSFKNSDILSEMFYSWGHIFNVLGKDNLDGHEILEYGPGSGQLSLFLARAGCKVYAVDIDDAWLNSIRLQAKAMNISVYTEKNIFGHGFGDKKFDNIIFFESFHHEINFADLMYKLRGRLKPGGAVIFCGEPIFPSPSDSLPYPWGPRLNGLSVVCIRQYGWMELGFTRDFFGRMLLMAGWRVSYLPFPNCGRADIYIATPISDVELNDGFTVEPGNVYPGIILDPREWSGDEGGHRWTISNTSTLPVPLDQGRKIKIDLSVANYLPIEKCIKITFGGKEEICILNSGQEKIIEIDGAAEPYITITSDLHSPSDLDKNSSDSRKLGIALTRICYKYS